MAYLDQSFAEPAESSVLVGAVQWLQGTLLGAVATTVAVVAIATIGLMMLAGRIDWRRGVTVLIGCFILFGASSIVAGIRSVVGTEGTAETPPAYAASPLVTFTPVKPSQSVPYDPYAGASVPPG